MLVGAERRQLLGIASRLAPRKKKPLTVIPAKALSDTRKKFLVEVELAASRSHRCTSPLDPFPDYPYTRCRSCYRLILNISVKQ